ncbi:MAG: transcription-repair coupling factor (superfamily II helicase) [Chloroflexi bacterium]|nr:MAG: transcription-repair coupling factor (superfamily II helicase) [Chloroflexota bacterium]
MGLTGLFPLLDAVPAFTRLAEALGREPCAIDYSCPESFQPLLLAALGRRLGQPILVLAPRPDTARHLHDQLLSWCGEQESVLYFPEAEALPYERLVPDDATVHQRLRALDALLQPENWEVAPIIVASVPAATQMTLEASAFAEASHVLRKGDRVELMDLMRRWETLGYRTERAVEVPGVVSHRGGILDIWPPSEVLPVRMELFGPEIDSVRHFDPGTQRSVDQIEAVRVIPAAEVLPSLTAAASLEKQWAKMDISTCNEATQDRLKEELTRLMAGQSVDELPFYAGFFCTGTLLDYLPSTSVLVIEQPSAVEAAAKEQDARAVNLRASKQDRGELPKGFPSSHITGKVLKADLERQPKALALDFWDAKNTAGDLLSPVTEYYGRMDKFLADLPNLIAGDARLVLASTHAARLSTVLAEAGYQVASQEDLQDTPQVGTVTLVHEALREGFTLTTSSGDIVLLTDVELFGTARRSRPRRRAPVRREVFLSELEPDGYVVHIEHGIGRFAGTQKMSAEEGELEYLILAYAEGDKLYVPTEQLDRVSPYVGSGEEAPTLTRLGTQEWARAKAKVKESAQEMAQELLDLYAARQTANGVPFALDTVWQQEMEDAFPFTETADQMRTIDEVKADMERPQPMDRVVCGDVGYGKTEVALRAAFKAVVDGHQVGVLVPTTILAQQHYATFSERLSPYPVTVEVLSRFRSDAEIRQVIEAAGKGEVDILIGTHRLLQKDVSFKKLGLVIVDEEQRFGVSHKERLKQMRKEVDVLTLTATPIPRTLHMALAGVRDMSTMETPPEERLPIKTYVSEYSEDLIREAILRELDRGGQTYFVHNRVNNIHAIAEQIRRLVPEASVGIGHGRMDEESLLDVMDSFSRGELDVLVCTTIIEAGLDIPNVNTMLINRADRFGLAQLYQLRGRIGRSGQRAYSYLLIPKDQKITETAEKRLKTILTATELGAGFRIAMKDLEIRGAGNLLGAEQSGYIKSVGFDLYSKLLAEAVEEVKRKPSETGTPYEPPLDVKIGLPLQAHIPEAYVSDLPTRLSLYQRAVSARKQKDVDSLEEEMTDRFGPSPESVGNLLYIARLRITAGEAQVTGVDRTGNHFLVRLGNWQGVDRAAIQRALGPSADVGHRQVKVDPKKLGQDWRNGLLLLVRRLAVLRRELMARLQQSGVIG